MGVWSDLIGTTLGYLRLGKTGVRLKDDAGVLAVRNAGDTADAKLRADGVHVGTAGKTWNAGSQVQVGSGGTHVFGDTYQAIFGSNSYYDSAWKRVGPTYKPTQYNHADGVHRWYAADAGAADSAITWSQLMTLDATTLTVAVDVAISKAASTAVARWTGGSVTTYAWSSPSGGLGAVGTETNHPFSIYVNNTERFSFGTAGQLGIGGANYGTAGYLMASGGASAAPTWLEYLAAGTNVTVTVKTSGGDFTTIEDAWDWACSVSRGPSMKTIIAVDPGVWEPASSLVLNPGIYGTIDITGTYYTTTLTSVASSSGSAGNYSYVLNVGDNSNIAVGDWVGIDYTSGGTNGAMLDGGFEVTAKGSGTITIKATHNAVLGVASGACTGSIYIFKTTLKFSGSGIVHGQAQTRLNIVNVAIVGTDANAANIGVSMSMGAVAFISQSTTGKCLIGGFATGLSCSLGAFARAPYMYFGRCSTTYTGACSAISVASGGVVSAVAVRGSPNGAAASETTAFRVAGSSSGIDTTSAKMAGCTYGAQVSRSASASMPSTTITSCTTGIYAVYGATVDANGTTLTSCTTTYSPAINTLGNNGSYINN